jgi:TetR/AcrR family transcriptional repressor of lmrAB and yxaGH operons
MTMRKIQAKATRARILETATRLFQTRGYHGTGMAEIALAAGAPKGLVYHHFPGGKAAIAASALEGVTAAVLTRLTEPKDQSTWQNLADLAREIASWGESRAWREGSLFAAFGIDLSLEDPSLAGLLLAHQNALVAALTARWEHEGHARAAARDRAFLALAALEGAMLAACLAQDGAPLLAIARAFDAYA